MKTILPLAALLLASSPALAFELTSPDIAEGKTLTAAQVANTFGCSGGNVSPGLAWKDAPAGTKSFTVTMYDPDAPTGSGWWHWVVYNIPASTTGLPTGAGTPDGKTLPKGAVQGNNDARVIGFLGACPPPGAPLHRHHHGPEGRKARSAGGCQRRNDRLHDDDEQPGQGHDHRDLRAVGMG